MITIKDPKIKKAYVRLIERSLVDAFNELIYVPLFKALAVRRPKAVNEESAVRAALREGDIYYVDGGFYAKDKFSNAISTELIKMGAVYDKFEKSYRIAYEDLPRSIAQYLLQKAKLAQLHLEIANQTLNDIELNLHTIVESMVFDKDVFSIVTDASEEVGRQARRLRIIEPELSEEQKQDIATNYTNNMQLRIKGWLTERISTMRQKVQRAILDGYREEDVRQMLVREYNIGARKAKFLAHNETNIMLTQLKKNMYQEMGFEEFVWNTMKDGRERPLHRQLDGKIFRFDQPPIIDERTGQRGLPGETYNCRCGFTPIRRTSLFVDRVDYEQRKRAGAQYLRADNELIFRHKGGKVIPINVDYVSFSKVKQGTPMSFEDAIKGANIVNKKGERARYNCQSCIVAAVARMFGYDVTAKYYDSNNKIMDELASHPEKAWRDPETGEHVDLTTFRPKDATEAKRILEREVQDGVYQMIFQVPTKIFDGHTALIHRDAQGRLEVADPQTGKFTSFDKYAKHIRYFYDAKIAKLPSIRGLQLLRVDTLGIDERVCEAVLTGK